MTPFKLGYSEFCFWQWAVVTVAVIVVGGILPFPHSFLVFASVGALVIMVINKMIYAVLGRITGKLIIQPAKYGIAVILPSIFAVATVFLAVMTCKDPSWPTLLRVNICDMDIGFPDNLVVLFGAPIIAAINNIISIYLSQRNPSN